MTNFPNVSPGDCPICGTSLTTLGGGGDCPTCKAPARARSLSPLLSQVIGPYIARMGAVARPLLAFGATKSERKLLMAHFASLKSVSLYGNYGGDHEVGVDVRNLSRYSAGSFSGAFGILLFDYFPEFKEALAELHRVIAPGGVFFTLILSQRVLPGSAPPSITREIRPRPGYFDYIPEGGVLHNVTVGQDWLLNAIEEARFDALQIRMIDRASGEVCQWFIGLKPNPIGIRVSPLAEEDSGEAADAFEGQSPSDEPDVVAASISRPPSASLASLRQAGPDLTAGSETVVGVPDGKVIGAPPSKSNVGNRVSRADSLLTKMTESFSQTFVTALEGFEGLRKVAVTLTIPSIPLAARRLDFAEHQWIESERRSGTSVVGLAVGKIWLSDDLAKSWRLIEPPEADGEILARCFTRENGERVLQSQGWLGPNQDYRNPSDCGKLFLLDKDLKVIKQIKNGDAHWHSPRSVGEAYGTMMYAEYYDNALIYRTDRNSEEWKQIRPNRVYRSKDGGRNWDISFELPPEVIRHFHLVMPDPYATNTWWLASGDRPAECCIWRSADNGDSWKEVTNPTPSVRLHPLVSNRRQCLFRTTDLAILPDKLIWGCDDSLGHPRPMPPGGQSSEVRRGEPVPSMGARLFVAAKSDRLEPREIGLGNHPFRNVVDVGAGYLALTEAKDLSFGYEPRVFFIDKREPHRTQYLFSIPNPRSIGTGFTYSMASRAATDGVFFSYRGRGDLTQNAARLLRWDVAFE